MSDISGAMAAPMKDLETLDERLSRIERLVYSANPRVSDQKDVIQNLERMTGKVGSAKDYSITLKKIYSQMDELQRLTALCHASTIEQPVGAKVDFIEASEKQLRDQARHLESVEKLKWVLDSEHLKSRVTSNLNSRLLQLAQVHSENREEADASIDQAKTLVDNYNKAISQISRQFEHWNALVTRLEGAQTAPLE